MMHLDFYVKPDEFENKISHALSCGAVLSEVQFYGEHMKVFVDPAGHPFCIIAVALPKMSGNRRTLIVSHPQLGAVAYL